LSRHRKLAERQFKFKPEFVASLIKRVLPRPTDPNLKKVVVRFVLSPIDGWFEKKVTLRFIERATEDHASCN
jgi:hypothetical protein